MKLLNVNAKNYRAICEAVLDFEGIRGAVISGENGSGKSSIIEAILWCLYGESRSGRRADGVVRLGADTAEVSVTFQAADTRWKVKRTRSTKGRGKSTLDVWRDDGGAWAPQTGKNMDGGEGDSQAVIDRALGITFDTLVNGPFMLQNDAARFCESKPEDRREVLRQILRLDEYRALQAQARAKAGTFETEAEIARRELDRQGDTGAALATARDNVGWAEEVRLDAQAVVADCEKLHEAARARVVLLRVAQDDQHRLAKKRAELEADVMRYRQQLDAAEKEVVALESTAAEWRAVEDAESKLPGIETREAEAAAQVSQAGANVERRRALEDRRTELGRAWKTAKTRHDEAQAEALGLAEAEATAATLDGELAAAADRTADLAEARHARDELTRALTQIDFHPDVVAARDEAARFEIAARQADERADAAGVALSKAIEASVSAKGAARRSLADVAATEAEIARLEKRTALLGEVPCAATERWRNTDTDDWAPTCDLAGTCKLLADARGAAVEVAQARVTLETQSAAAEAAEAARREAAEAAEAAAEELAEARRHVLAARAHVADAKAVADNVRDDLRAAYHSGVKAAEQRVREAEDVVRKAEAKVAEVRRVADSVATKRAAADRAAAAAAEMATVETTGAQVRGELAALPPAEEMAAMQLALHSVRAELHSVRAITARREAVEAAKDQHGPALVRKLATARNFTHANLALAECVLDPAIVEKMNEADNEQTLTEANLKTARAAASTAERAHATAEAEEERAEEIHEATRTLREQVEAKLAEARLWQQTGEALHLAAVVLIERAIPIIEAEANRVLAQVSSRGMRLNLETQRANKTTDGIRETLDVLIEDNAGRRPYEDYSGGEQFRANLALRLGLARLLADREGVPIECVVIDEGGFGALDPTGIAAMKEVVAALQRQFSLVLLVTHIPDVADCLPHLIRVEAGPNGSILRRVA